MESFGQILLVGVTIVLAYFFYKRAKKRDDDKS